MANVAFSGLPVTGSMSDSSIMAVVVSGTTSQISGSNLKAYLGIPSGANTQIQFNNANALAGSANLTFNNTTNTLAVPAISVSGNANVGNVNTFTGRLRTTAANGFVFDENVARVNIGSSATIVNVGGVTTGVYVQGTLETYGNLNSVGNLNVTGESNLGAVANVHITGGSNNQVLRTDGLGNLSWATVSGGGGTPAGSNTQLQFNDAGSFGGSANLTFNKTTNTLAVTSLTVSGNANVGNVNTFTGRLRTTAATGFVFDENVARVNIGSSATIVNVGGVTTGIYVQGTLETYGNLNSVGNINSTGAIYLGNISNVHADGGNAGEFLQTDGAGNLTWAAGGGTPAGSNTQIQFNNAGSFGGSANLTFNTATKTLTAANLNATNLVVAGSMNAATSLSILLPPIANIAFSSPMPTANGTVLTVINQETGTVNWAYPDIIDSPDTTTYVEAANTAISMTVSGNLEASFESNTFTTNNIVANGNITGNTNGFTIGYLNVPQVAAGANATFALEDAGKHYYNTTAANFTLTVPNNTSVSFSTGTAITVVNQSANTIAIAQGTGVTMFVAGNATSGNRTIGAYGMATIMKVATNTWFINGTGVN